MNGHDLVVLGQESPGHAGMEVQVPAIRAVDAQMDQAGAAQKARRHHPCGTGRAVSAAGGRVAG